MNLSGAIAVKPGYPPPSGPRARDEFVGHIRIVDTLGVGGMGEVYVGWDEALERRVALKAIRQRHRMRPEVKARFLREARVLSQLDHPNICRIYDYVAGEDRDFLVLELIEGKSLGRVIKGDDEASDDRELDDARRLEIAEGIAGALATAHAKGVVHRDLKPANVMITGEGVVKVLDFGIARSIGTPGGATPPDEATGPAPEESTEGATLLERPVRLPDAGGDPAARYDDGGTTLGVPAEPEGSEETPAEEASRFASGEANATEPESWTVHGSVLGSPGYLSPEQAHGEPATTASDMYVFGLLLQELFTGRPPYPPDLSVPQLVLRAQKGERVPLDGVRSDVAGLIDELLDPAAAARPTAIQTLERIRWIRDKPRRRLIRGAIAAVILLLVLSGVKYTLDLKAARDEAQLHRSQAEDLIGFMLGDLRDKLSEVGRLELLEDVGDQALDYFESLPVENRTDDELFRRSKALRQIGEVRIAQGDLPAAMAAFKESERLATALVERNPERDEWLLGLGHSHFWQGNVHWLQGDLPASRDRFEEYREITERLVAEDAANKEWRLEEGYAATNLAAVHQAMGEEEKALEALDNSLAIKEDLLRRDPDDNELRRSLANGLSWQGTMLIGQGELARAAESFRREGEIRRALVAADPANADARVLLAVNLSQAGKLAVVRGDLEAGHRGLSEALDLYSDLVRHDPENSDWLRYLGVAHLQIADLDLATDDAAAAHRSLERAEEILDSLAAREPSNRTVLREVALTHLQRARLELVQGRPRRALDPATAGRELVESLLEASPEKRQLQADAGECHLVLGRIHSDLGNGDAAREHWRQTVELIRPLVGSSGTLTWVSTLAQSLLHLGRDGEARSLVSELERAGYDEPGWRRAAERYGFEIH